ncbi:hypothetical protein [Halobaculum sp. D14]|uniref:hypothetical protein n=1 Tax=Halobaculum sp. D14 TaxID=3421642 RepID=UPI003EBC1C16
MSAQHGDNSWKWRVPPATGKHRDGSPSTYTLTWHPTRSHTKKALFRIDTDDGVATLQHIREIVTQQRGESTHDLITDPELTDIPPQLLAILKDEGFTPATEVER